MSTFRRGKIWWFKFNFQGQVIRESANTSSMRMARDAERARRHDLERAVNGIPKRAKYPLFKIAAREWIDSKTHLAAKSVYAYKQYVDSLTKEFGNRLVCDLDETDIVELQRNRQREKKSGRTINYEVHALRGILKHFNLWWPLADKVKKLQERHDIGKALSRDEELRLLDAVAKSGSPVLLPLFVVSLDTGLRASEVRALRRKDLIATLAGGQISEGELHVPKSKTAAGTGRVVPLTARACNALTRWLSAIPEAGDDAYLFPHHEVGCCGSLRKPKIFEIEFDKPIGEWKSAWKSALTTAKVKARWHDLRHTLISRLAENPAVSEETIRALAGHVSRQMLARYSHIRSAAKWDAIRTLNAAGSDDDRAQNWGTI
jgi:integrase